MNPHRAVTLLLVAAGVSITVAAPAAAAGAQPAPTPLPVDEVLEALPLDDVPGLDVRTLLLAAGVLLLVGGVVTARIFSRRQTAQDVARSVG